MPLATHSPMRRPKPALDLPPPFRLVTLREVGDAFAHATAIAAEEGAGTLVYVGRFDLAEFAVVLEPEEPLRTARRAFYAGMAALADALRRMRRRRSRSPSTGPTPSASTAGWSAAAGSPGRDGADEDEPPAWLVFGAMIRTVCDGRGASRACVRCGGARRGRLRRSRLRPPGRELRAASDGRARRLAGAGLCASRRELPAPAGAREGRAPRHRRATAICWCGAWPRPRPARHSLVAALAAAVVARSRNRRAAHGETVCAPSGSIRRTRSCSSAPPSRANGRCRAPSVLRTAIPTRSPARRAPPSAAASSASTRSAGRRWCRSSRRARTIALPLEMLAQQLVEHFGAPDLAAARAAAEEEVAFAASLCDHPNGMLVAVPRTFEDGAIREASARWPARRAQAAAGIFVPRGRGRGRAGRDVDLVDLRAKGKRTPSA